MDDSEAMINQLRDRSMSEVTLAQVAAATKKVIDNPRLEDAMCKSIRGLSTGGTQFRCLLEEVHIALKILSKQHAKLQAFVERWAKFRTVRYPYLFMRLWLNPGAFRVSNSTSSGLAYPQPKCSFF
jgi:hypothetical protein